MKVDFHSGIADKLGAACRFVRKAQAAGATLVVCGDAATLDRLDTALWSIDPVSFVAHARVSATAPPPALARTPTWLVDDAAAVAPRELLLNLGPDMARGWQGFARVVEIVSTDDAGAGRQRWREYSAQAGIELVHHARGGSA